MDLLGLLLQFHDVLAYSGAVLDRFGLLFAADEGFYVFVEPGSKSFTLFFTFVSIIMVIFLGDVHEFLVMGLEKELLVTIVFLQAHN